MGNPSSRKENFRSQKIYQEVLKKKKKEEEEVLPNILGTGNIKCYTKYPRDRKRATLPNSSDDISWALKPDKGFKRNKMKGWHLSGTQLL